jgi:hypothetical protein
MRLSDALLRRHQTKLIYPDHRLPPWLIEATTRSDCSNRLLDCTGYLSCVHPNIDGRSSFVKAFSTPPITSKATFGSPQTFTLGFSSG